LGKSWLSCWVKGADGWTTARSNGTSFAPENLLRQYRDVAADGVEWAGEVTFKSFPAREAGDPGVALDGIAGLSVNRQRGKWTQWVDYPPDAVRVQKVKGKWQVSHDNNLLRGKLPTPGRFRAGGREVTRIPADRRARV
jgi:hypothetical protein